MVIRTDTKDFPFDYKGGKVGYFFVEIDKGKIKEEYFTASGTGKRKLVAKIKTCQKGKKEFKIYGVWMGEWKTHLFILPPELLLKALKQ